MKISRTSHFLFNELICNSNNGNISFSSRKDDRYPIKKKYFIKFLKKDIYSFVLNQFQKIFLN